MAYGFHKGGVLRRVIMCHLAIIGEMPISTNNSSDMPYCTLFLLAQPANLLFPFC